MDKTQEELIASAKEIIGTRSLSSDAACGSVAAALAAADGMIYRGICLDTPCSLGFCAEQAAVASMLAAGESRVEAIVAISEDGSILPPCGRCRELLYQINHDNLSAVVFLPDGSTKLSNLLPCVWNP